MFSITRESLKLDVKFEYPSTMASGLCRLGFIDFLKHNYTKWVYITLLQYHSKGDGISNSACIESQINFPVTVPKSLIQFA